jgi:hypothetical protein
MAKLDGFYILVETEDPVFPNEVTDQPVEKGVPLSDHVQRQARSVALSGVIVGADAVKVRSYLISASDNGKLVKYVGRIAFNGVISGLATSHSHKIANGFTFSFTLREIRIAETSAAGKLPAAVKSQAAPIINAGTKKTKSTGASKSKNSTKKAKEATQKVTFVAGSKWS